MTPLNIHNFQRRGQFQEGSLCKKAGRANLNIINSLTFCYLKAQAYSSEEIPGEFLVKIKKSINANDAIKDLAISG